MINGIIILGSWGFFFVRRGWMKTPSHNLYLALARASLRLLTKCLGAAYYSYYLFVVRYTLYYIII